MLYIIFALFIAVLSVCYFRPTKRKRLIGQIITDLKEYKEIAPRDEQYGVGENIRFFKASKHVITFLMWQLFYASSIDADNLLEIADLPLPRWERMLYKDLQRVERRRFPGLLRPLTTTLSNLDARVFLDIGCGTMEVERQLMQALQAKGDKKPRVFVGLDMSGSAYEMIQKTFEHDSDKVSIHRIPSLESNIIKPFVDSGHKKHQVLFVEADAMHAADPNNYPVDVVYSSKFKHHLKHSLKLPFDHAIAPLGKIVLEFDDYRTATSWIPISITAWKRPVLLNGGLLSRLRQPFKAKLSKQPNVLFFSPPGSYIKQIEL